MSTQGPCEHCGKPIPPRTDPRGRRARFRSDACRAAASRERREQRHRDEVTQAREQLALRMPDEQAADAAELVRTMPHDLRAGRKVPATPQHQELVAAIKEFTATIDAQTDMTTPTRHFHISNATHSNAKSERATTRTGNPNP